VTSSWVIARLVLRSWAMRLGPSWRSAVATLIALAALVAAGLAAVPGAFEVAALVEPGGRTVALLVSGLAVAALFAAAYQAGEPVLATGLHRSLLPLPLPNRTLWAGALIPSLLVLGGASALFGPVVVRLAVAIDASRPWVDVAVVVTVVLAHALLAGAAAQMVVACRSERRARSGLTRMLVPLALVAVLALVGLVAIASNQALAVSVIWPAALLAVPGSTTGAVPVAIGLAALALPIAAWWALAGRTVPRARPEAGSRHVRISALAPQELPLFSLSLARLLRTSSLWGLMVIYAVLALVLAIATTRPAAPLDPVDGAAVVGFLVALTAMLLRGLARRERPIELMLGLSALRWVGAQVGAVCFVTAIAGAPAVVVVSVRASLFDAAAVAALGVFAAAMGVAVGAALTPPPSSTPAIVAGLAAYAVLASVVGTIAARLLPDADARGLALGYLSLVPVAIAAGASHERRRFVRLTGAAPPSTAAPPAPEPSR
jgi:hypothetical protein